MIEDIDFNEIIENLSILELQEDVTIYSYHELLCYLTQNNIRKLISKIIGVLKDLNYEYGYRVGSKVIKGAIYY